MKINQKFTKKALLAASLTAGAIGFNSMFNEVQATGGGSNYLLSKCIPPGGSGFTGIQCTSSSLGNCAGSQSCF